MAGILGMTQKAATKPGLLTTDVNAMYQQSLGRTAKPDEQNYWIDAASKGVDAGTQIANSPEAQRYMQSKTVQTPTSIVPPANISTPAQAPAPAASASSYTAPTTTAAATSYQTRDAQAQSYEAKPWEVSGNQTVAEQIRQITGGGSPLMQQAETAGLMAANKRGLANSSIAVGAAQDSLYRAALPIAQQDAGTYAQAAQFSANAQNQALAQNAQLGTNVSLSNAQQANVAAGANAAALNSASQFNANAQNVAALSAVDMVLKKQLADLSASTTLAAADKQYQTQIAIAEAQNKTNIAISNGDNITKQILSRQDADTRLGLAQVDANTKIGIANLDVQARATLAKLDNDNKQLLQTNTNAAQMYQQYSVNLANIQNNKDMNQAAKDAAITTQLNSLNAGLQAVGEVAKLDLSKYFQRADNQPVPTPTAQAEPKALARQEAIDFGGG